MVEPGADADPADAGAPAGEQGLRARCAEVLEAHWRGTFTCPNAATYPWLWLWDSCFHAVVWAELGRADRAVAELDAALGSIDAEGFVPHIRYLDGSTDHDEFWGRPATSSITQPPIYGHAVAELHRRGAPVPPAVVERADAGLQWLLRRRWRSTGGLVQVVHPWESGCDHSPRWDDVMDPPARSGSAPSPATVGDRYDPTVWFRRKGELLATVERSPGGAPLHNPACAVGSVGFSALVAWCAAELASVTGSAALRTGADELAVAVRRRFDPELRTWVDDGPTEGGSGSVRTADGLLALLVEDRAEVLDLVVAELADPLGIGGSAGVAGVDRREPTFRRGSYWRGPSWPQLDYLLWVALVRAGRTAAADRLALATRRGATGSGFAEYWDPDDAGPGGAVPQSWSTLAAVARPSAPQ